MFRTACSAAPEDATAHLGLGAALKGLGDDHTAMEEFLRAIQLDPKLTQAYEYLGETQLGQHEYQDAITSLTQAERLNPADPELEDHLGDAYRQSGKKEEAQAAFGRAAKLRQQGPIPDPGTKKAQP